MEQSHMQIVGMYIILEWEEVTSSVLESLPMRPTSLEQDLRHPPISGIAETEICIVIIWAYQYCHLFICKTGLSTVPITDKKADQFDRMFRWQQLEHSWSAVIGHDQLWNSDWQYTIYSLLIDKCWFWFDVSVKWESMFTHEVISPC
jgi:hypothetical protein